MLVSSSNEARSHNDWIGNLPDGWQRRPLFALFSERGETNDGYKTENVLSVLKDVGVINYEDKGDVGNKKSEDIERYKIVHAGDLVINSMNVIIGSVGVSSEYGALSPVYIVLRRRALDADIRYFGYVFASRDFQRWLTRIGYGILAHRMRIPLDNLKREYVPCPPFEQQRHIADFLDRETTKADALVAKYERLIELLEEKRVALITQAITKGLDPDVPMKDSGVVGVGAIPANWDVASVWMLFEIGRGRVISHEDIANNPGDYPVYSSQTENEGEMGRIGTYDFEGDYLTWTTDGARAGTVFERTRRFNCTNVCGTLKLKKLRSGNLTYFRYAIDLATKYFVRMDINPKLMNDVMARIRIPVPPTYVQEKIEKVISDQLSSNEVLKTKVLASIDLIREHRAALITATVTGQINARTYKTKDLEDVVA